MAQDDDYVTAGRQRILAIDAAIAASQADLAAHRLNRDFDAMGEAEQQIANLAAEKRNMFALHAEYQQFQNPPAPPPLTKEEREAKPWTKMDYSDVWEMSRSKYGAPDEAMFRAGIAEAARRRARGE